MFLGISFGHKMSSITSALRQNKSSQGDTHKYIYAIIEGIPFIFSSLLNRFILSNNWYVTASKGLVNQLLAVSVTASFKSPNQTHCLVLMKL